MIITTELLELMLQNDAQHMINACLLKDGKQKFNEEELSQKMYDYYKRNNLKVVGTRRVAPGFLIDKMT